jgi:hypothetical protein
LIGIEGTDAMRYPLGRVGLALDGAGSMPSAALPRRRPSVERRPRTAGHGAVSVLRYIAAPWMAPISHRYETSNRHLMRLVEWVTGRTWPLAGLDEICRWFQKGSIVSRLLAGSAVASAIALLLSLPWQSLYGLQAMALLPLFAGHGVLVLLAASFLIGAMVLPVLLGHVLPMLLRLYVLVNLGTIAALLGYGIWLLYSSTKP